MRNVLLFTLSIIGSSLSYAQVPGITWQKSLGGTGTEDARSVQPTSDGGYIVGGTTSSNDGDVTGNHGGKDCWVVKLSSTGSIEWQKTLGGTGNETFGSIRVTADSGFIMAATTSSNDGDVSGNHGTDDAWVVKLSSTGVIEWQKCFGSTGYDALGFIEETSDGGYIGKGTCGNNDGDVVPHLPDEVGGGWIFKLSESRTIEWQKTWQSYNVVQYYINSIRQTSDGGYVYSGVSSAYMNDYYFIGKLDSAGNGVGGDNWDSYASGERGMESPRSIVPTADGGCVMLNMSYNQTTFYIPAIKKYSSTMVPEWTKLLENCVFSYPLHITNTRDGGFLIIGTTAQPMAGIQGGGDYWMSKLNSTGAFQWQRALGSAGNDIPYWGESLTDSGYIVAGKGAANSGDITGNHGGDDFWVARLPYTSPNFAIISSAGPNGTISPNGGNIFPSGSNQPFTITPAAGYHIADVLVDNVSNASAISTGTYTFTNITASHTVSVTFALNTYTIVSTPGSHGYISPNGTATINHGESRTYIISPAAGYSILDVLIDNVSIGPATTYTFSNISANHTIQSIYAIVDSASAFVCPPVDSGTITSNISGTSYHWQLNAGNGFYNLSDGYYFGGTQTATLTIRYYQPSNFGYRYRCVVDSAGSYEFILKFKDTWTGAFDDHWEIPQNWSCGKIPDANTDVVIPAGTNLTIITNITIRSLSLGTGANITVAPGGNLIILH